MPGVDNTSPNNSDISVDESPPSKGKGCQPGMDLPHLVRLGGGRKGSAVSILPLPEGRTCIGTIQASSPQDIVITGTGVEEQHCYIEHYNGLVTLHPFAILCSVDGLQKSRPTPLTPGCMLCLGRSNYFRFHQPSSQQKVKDTFVEANVTIATTRTSPGGSRSPSNWQHFPTTSAVSPNNNFRTTASISLNSSTSSPSTGQPRYQQLSNTQHENNKHTAHRKDTPFASTGQGRYHPLSNAQQDDKQYRDSLEGADFVQKLSRFEHLSGPDEQRPVYSSPQQKPISPTSYNGLNKQYTHQRSPQTNLVNLPNYKRPTSPTVSSPPADGSAGLQSPSLVRRAQNYLRSVKSPPPVGGVSNEAFNSDTNSSFSQHSNPTITPLDSRGVLSSPIAPLILGRPPSP